MYYNQNNSRYSQVFDRLGSPTTGAGSEVPAQLWTAPRTALRVAGLRKAHAFCAVRHEA